MDAAELVIARRDELPLDRNDRGYQTYPRNPWAGIRGLELAMKFCLNRIADGEVVGLAHLIKKVPAEYVSRACTIGRGPETWVVKCVCERDEFVAAELVECRGGCGRWFFANEAAVWSLLLPEQEPDE